MTRKGLELARESVLRARARMYRAQEMWKQAVAEAEVLTAELHRTWARVYDLTTRRIRKKLLRMQAMDQIRKKLRRANDKRNGALFELHQWEDKLQVAEQRLRREEVQAENEKAWRAEAEPQPEMRRELDAMRARIKEQNAAQSAMQTEMNRMRRQMERFRETEEPPPY